MAVRFLPPPEERPTPPREDTGNLAEVIEFRSRLRRPIPDSEAAPEPGAAPTSSWASAPQPASGTGTASGWAQAPLRTDSGRGEGAERGGVAEWSDDAAPRGGTASGGEAEWSDDAAPRGDTASGGVAERGDDATPGGDAAASRAQHSWARLIEVPFGRARGGEPQGLSGQQLRPGQEPEKEPASVARAEPELESADEAFAGDEDGPTAYETSVKLLARKPLSSGELQRALVAAGHPEIDAEEAVAKCEDSLYLDDADLANSLATKLRESKGESKARIRQKLRERYLPDAAIEAALDELDDDEELALLKQTAIDRARRMTGLDRQTAERRLLGFLARRGWSGERASRAAKEALDGVGGTGGGRGTVRFR